MNANVNQNGYFVVNYGDFRMPDWLLKANLSPGAKLTYSVLGCCAGGKDHVWPSQEFLAEKISASIRSVQRYLEELIAFGLIEKGRQWVKGRVRCIYRFLTHELNVAIKAAPNKLKEPHIHRPEQHAKLSPCSDMIGPPVVAQNEKILQTNTTKCREQHDILSCSLNKEETIKRKEEISPPTPQTENPGSGQPIMATGKGEDFFSGVKEEDSRWKAVKEFLTTELSESNMKTWIDPLIFERKGDTAVLRSPNQFFSAWVTKNFKGSLTTAFEIAGITSWRIELQTEEQLAALEAARAEQTPKAVDAHPVVPVEEDLEALSPDEQFDRLFEVYPVKKVESESRRIFLRLKHQRNLPELKTLIKSIKDHVNNDRWWREKMPPLLTNWLIQKKWRDRPYE